MSAPNVSRPAQTALKAWLAEDLLSRKFPPKEPLIVDLLHRRDLVALGARRRHGKTSLTTNIAVALALGLPDFIGYRIPVPARSLLLMLEDDPGEYQEKLACMIDGRDCCGRIRIITREDFYQSGIPIDVSNGSFQDAVRYWASQHRPDLIGVDNLAHVINAEYGEPTRVHNLMVFCYQLAAQHNAAIILAAHPKKDGDDPVSLKDSPRRFFESIMGSSHFINSTGSLWGLERPDGEDHSIFLGGRQRGDGNQQHCYLEMDDKRWFRLVPQALAQLELVLNTPGRRHAWKLLPDPPVMFGYREGEEMVRAAMRSKATFNAWIRQLRRIGAVIEEGGKLVKAGGLPQEIIPGLRG